ncbi:Hypothetical protein A7982_11046 [Minicystis rosea]|nr:Hypothetical protein A7982_11046 [Minicystis rosea]
MEAAMERAAAGCDAKAGLEGLDLGPYAHGVSAIDYLIHPSWLEDASREVWLRVVDWLIDAGADPTAAFQRALALQLPFIAHHLAARGALPDPNGALRAAFVDRQLGLARALVAGGADPATLADVVRADLITPAKVDVRYRASAEEQRVTVKVLMLVGTSASERESVVKHAATLFQRLGAAGGLGSDVFAPALSRVTEASFEQRQVDEETFEAVSILRARGVAPAGLALVLRALVGARSNAFPAAITIEGELPLDGSDCSVDTARALRWFADASVDVPKPFSPPSISASSKAKKKVFAIVEHAAGRGREVAKALGPIDVEHLSRPEVIAFDAGEPMPMMHFDAKQGDARSDIVLKAFGNTDAPVDHALLRSVFINVMSAVPGVTALTWCDEAGLPAAPPAAETPAKQPAATKKQAASAVVSVDIGPSLVPEVRKALSARGEPPWAGRAKKVAKKKAAASIPASFTDGSPLPPTLREWLAFGDESQPLAGKAPFTPQRFSALLRVLFSRSEGVAEAFAPLEESLFPGPCIPLYVPELCSDLTTLFLYLPLADASGEAPVVGFDFTDDGIIGVFAPRFDHYLARVLGLQRYRYAFGPIPGIDPFVDALLAKLPPRLRKLAKGEKGIINAGPLTR